MSYGSPSPASAVDDLLAQGVELIVVLPLHPQHSCSTVAAVWGRTGAGFWRKSAPFRGISFIRDYAEHPDYIHASWRPACALPSPSMGNRILLLLSYQRIPQRYANQGDDYPQRCRDTTRELVSALGLPPERVMMTFQSRFGREPWLTPYTDETLKDARRERDEAYPGAVPGVCRRLSRNAGRNRRPEPGNIPRSRRQAI
ncbi:ferrochelatase [Klebsiella pneumoniae]|nr:ferrochelatase [Klebsiella pneumoniae]